MDAMRSHVELAKQLDALPRAIHALVVLSRECAAVNEFPDLLSSASEDSLSQWDIGPEDLEWLLDAKYVEPAATRQARRNASQTATNRRSGCKARLIVTPAGSTFLERIFTAVALNPAVADGAQSLHEIPHWDGEELRFHGVLLKRFQRPARNQERLLDEFENQWWAKCISNPLPGLADISPSDQLRDAVKRLNRSLQAPLIRFGGDGTGTGVYWRRMAPHPPDTRCPVNSQPDTNSMRKRDRVLTLSRSRGIDAGS